MTQSCPNHFNRIPKSLIKHKMIHSIPVTSSKSHRHISRLAPNCQTRATTPYAIRVLLVCIDKQVFLHGKENSFANPHNKERQTDASVLCTKPEENRPCPKVVCNSSETIFSLHIRQIHQPTPAGRTV